MYNRKAMSKLGRSAPVNAEARPVGGEARPLRRRGQKFQGAMPPKFLVTARGGPISGRIRPCPFSQRPKQAAVSFKFKNFRFRGVALLVARLLWEQDAAGSSPVTSTSI